MYPFSLPAFNIFFFIFSFQNFNYDCVLVWIFRSPFPLPSLCFLDLWVCVFFYIWEVFSHNFFIHSFSPTLLLSLWNFDDTSAGSFVTVPHFPEALLVIFSVCFLFLLRLGDFSCSVLKFTDSVLCSLYYWVYPVSFYISVTLFFIQYFL